MAVIETDILTIGYACGGRKTAPFVLLLHGWPDDATAWLRVAPKLEAAGFRWAAPWLRGFGNTRFKREETCRDGSTAALAQDALDLLAALGIDRFSVVGHDWGARIGYALAALVPDRVHALIALSLGYTPKGDFPVPAFEQSRAWWYQWFMSVDRGAEAVAADPIGFARLQWQTWSPPEWFDENEFARTAESFKNPDWLAITLNSYRSRWRDAPQDSRYDSLRQRMATVESLSVPTLLLQGMADGTVLPKSTEGREIYFTGGYRRVELDDVGHFPTREAPDAVATAVIEHLDAVYDESSSRRRI
ncbi:MAG TPA: alpha/beta hydrolase [Hyphomicrobium sp.]|nr:alpha/beta hydrolase [Hyphomicrobium sp.]